MKTNSDYEAFMNFISVMLSLAIFTFVTLTLHYLMDNVFINNFMIKEFNHPPEIFIILVGVFTTIPIYSLFYQELIKEK